MNRLHTITEKIPSPFGSLYAHVSHDAAGHVLEISFSSPGKFSDTSIGDLLTALGNAATSVFADIGKGSV